MRHRKIIRKSVISGFRCDIDEICTLLGYYATSSGNPLPKMWNAPRFCVILVFHTFGKGLPLDAA
jgi:hypothetical protein